MAPSPRRLATTLAACALLLPAIGATVQAADTLTHVHDFAGPYQTAPDCDPRLIQASDGNLYGTTYGGDASDGGGDGTVYRLTPDGVFTTLHSFGGADGAAPASGVIQGNDGNFYGTTCRGGANDAGTIFRLTPDGTLVTLYSFDPANDGFGSRSALARGSDGNFYGVTNGFAPDGTGYRDTFYRVTPAGVFTTLHRFDGSEGSGPDSTPVLGPDGNFYGTMAYYGNNLGSVYRITPGGTPTLVHAFLDFTQGTTPGPLLAGSDGNLYGTTAGGGPGSGFGVVYRLTPDGGTYTVLHAFEPTPEGYNPDGEGPINGLVQDGGGNLYGETSYGFETANTSFHGTLFRLAPDGTLTTLHKIEDGYVNDAGPRGTLLLAKDGQLYGSTTAGGVSIAGYVFRVTTDAVAPVVPLPPDYFVPSVDLDTIATNEITDTQPGKFALSLASALTVDLKVNYQVTGTAQTGVDYVALKGVAKLKAGKTVKYIDLVPIAIPHDPGRKRVVKTVKVTLLPGDGYKLRDGFTTRKIKITHP